MSIVFLKSSKLGTDSLTVNKLQEHLFKIYLISYNMKPVEIKIVILMFGNV